MSSTLIKTDVRGKSRTKNKKISIFLVFLFALVDILGFSIILPLLPYYAEKYNTTPSMNGWLLSSNAIAQLLSAPIIGYLSDRYGRRPLLLLCLTGTVISFGLLVGANSFETILVSRIVDGLFGGNISLAYTYVCDITGPIERANGIGMIGAAFGIGFIIGPAVGGVLSTWSTTYPVYAALFLSILNLIGVYILLPEPFKDCNKSIENSKTNKMEDNNNVNKNDTKEQLVDVISVVWLVVNTRVLRPLLFLRFFYGMFFTIFEASSSMFNRKRLGYEARESSYVLCFVGLLFSLMQGGIMRRIVKWNSSRNTNEEIINNKETINMDKKKRKEMINIGKKNKEEEERRERKDLLHSSSSSLLELLWVELNVLNIGLIVAAISLGFWARAKDSVTLLSALGPFGLAAGAVSTMSNTAISKVSSAAHMGSTLGVASSIGSLTRIIAPIVAGYSMMSSFGETAPGILASVMAIAALGCVYWWKKVVEYEYERNNKNK